MSKNGINDLINELSKKAGISELIINRNDNVYVEKDGEMIRIDAKFSDEEIEDF
jgi:Flp pilus assembly CpaF family ATPase